MYCNVIIYLFSKAELKSFIGTHDTYTFHREARHRHKRNMVQVAGIGQQMDVDLYDIVKLKNLKRGTKCLLTGIGCFSRLAFVRSLRNKRGTTVINGRHSERTRSKTHSNRRGKGDKHFLSYSPLYCPIVERFSQSLEKQLYR